MPPVDRLNFTRLNPSTQSDDEFCVKYDSKPRVPQSLTLYSIVFIHGLLGHPRKTWEAAATPSKRGNDATKSRSSQKSSIFQRQSDKSPKSGTGSSSSSTVFWPEEYLVPDIPQACVWTYGYDADVVGGLFQAKNKNSVSQHGRDLAAGLERDIRNKVQAMLVLSDLEKLCV